MHQAGDQAKVRSRASDPATIQLVGKLKADLAVAYGIEAATATKHYVGSYYCLACHQLDTWKDTLHATGLKTLKIQYSMIPKWGAVNDANRNGIDDFRDSLSLATQPAWAAYGGNAPKLGYSAADGYYMYIGQVKYRVHFAYGGSGEYKQYYVTQPMAADGKCRGHYVLPVAYIEATHEYTMTEPQFWYNPNRTPIYTAASRRADFSAGYSFDAGCAGCHFTQVRQMSRTADGEWVAQPSVTNLFPDDDPRYIDYNGDGIGDEINTGCERCHGGGSLHILGQGDPSQIVNPADLNTTQKSWLCGSCHARGQSKPSGKFGFPWDETFQHGYVLGTDPALYQTDGGIYWGDPARTSKDHGQQWQDFQRSLHFTNPWEKLSCLDCHDPHEFADKAARPEREIELTSGATVTIPTSFKDNTICLSCHAGYGPFDTLTKDMLVDMSANSELFRAVIEPHGHHPYAPDRIMGLDNCVKCHFPTTAGSGTSLDISSHLLEVTPPEKTLRYAMPNACAASCHSLRVNVWGAGFDPDPSIWTEPFDIQLANTLMEYYGPQGAWWELTLSAAHEKTESRPTPDLKD